MSVTPPCAHRPRWQRTALAALVLATSLTALPAGEFLIRDGDRPVVFLGDSITEQRMYTTYIEAYVLSRFPTWSLTFRNIGWGGDTAWLSQRRGFDNGMRRDVLPLKPAVITIDFGMNDARGGDNNLPRYVEHLGKMVAQLKAAGARIALVTPSPEERYEADQPGGSAYNRMLAKYSQALREIAVREQVLFIDQYTPFIATIAAGRAAGVLGPTGAPRLIPDAVHPNWAGQLVMAAAILKGLGAPALVSRAEIDASGRRVVAAEGCRIELEAGAAGELVFARTDAALPWPLHADAALTLSIPGFAALDELSRYELRVTGLAEATYDLTIDGQPATQVTAAALAAGVNLSRTAGVITAQADKLFQRIIEKNNIYFTRWRSVQLFEPPAWLAGTDIEARRQTELDKHDALIARLEGEIDALRKPTPHRFSLRPAAAR